MTSSQATPKDATKLVSTVESILFVSPRPLPFKRLVELTGASLEEITVAVQTLAGLLAQEDRGLRLLESGKEVQLVTSPEASGVVQRFLKEEQTGELTRAALETLTIIAYRGPVTKIELDTIRGVNCTLILRTLQIRGLVEAATEGRGGQPRYAVTPDFLRHLGLTRTAELPDYDKLNADKTLQDLLAAEQSAALPKQAEPAATTIDAASSHEEAS